VHEAVQGAVQEAVQAPAVEAGLEPAADAELAPAGEAPDAPAPTTAEPAAAERVTATRAVNGPETPGDAARRGSRPRPGNRGGRGRRSSVPSWDDIMFGAKKD
jgi:hypothetical protein